MGVIGNIISKLSGPKRVQATKYDAAQTTTDNSRKWKNADHLSANSSMPPVVRSTLRARARQEIANNGYAKGMVKTLCNDVIGTGPRLQVKTDSEAANKTIEREWRKWSKKIKLAQKLHLMRAGRIESGEVFAMLTTNPKLTTAVKLDIRVIEADQVTSPYLYASPITAVDGIVFDEYNNPVEYHVLKTHPGELFGGLNSGFDRIPAEFMIHYYRWDRPNQARGIPEITPSLELFNDFRRYTEATIAAAETAADHAGVIETESPTPDEPNAFETVEIEKRMLTVLPAGTRMAQLKPEQPTTTYSMFKGELLDELARPQCIPSNVMKGNSSNYNYASGRLDHQSYWKGTDIDQTFTEYDVVDVILAAFLRELILIAITENANPELRTLAGVDVDDIDHMWFWDGTEHVDPQKEANAQETRLRNRTTTLADEWGRAGYYWRDKIDQIAEEEAYLKAKGMTPQQAVPQPAQVDDEEEDED